jgi:hypothetical protein
MYTFARFYHVCKLICHFPFQINCGWESKALHAYLQPLLLPTAMPPVGDLWTFDLLTWDRRYDFKNIFAEKFSKKLAFLTQNEGKFWKNLIITLAFEKKPILSPKIGKNRRKLWS